MAKPMIRIHNAETNEIIDRVMNDAELAQFELDKQEFAKRKADDAAKAEAKAALLDRLGITAEEVQLLLA